MAIERGARGDTRQRRMWQRLSIGEAFEGGSGIVVDGNQISLSGFGGFFFGSQSGVKTYPTNAGGGPVGDTERAISWMGL